MKERPILFNTEMVQAILAGRKTQTRRPAKGITFNEKVGFCCKGWAHGIGGSYKETMNHILTSKYGPRLAVGDRLWVRETWCKGRIDETDAEHPLDRQYYVEQTGAAGEYVLHKTECLNNGIDISEVVWRPSIHMPRTACRIILEITNVRVERLQDITESDAAAEGFDIPAAEGMSWKFTAKHNFKFKWDLLYKNWSENPWVWVFEFKVLTTNGKVSEVVA